MNKKILSLVLTLVMITASFSMAFAAVPSDVVGTPVEAAVTRLGDLGVILGYPDGTFRPFENITRSEFAVVATKAKGFGQLAISSQGPTNFGDVMANGWSSGYINVAEQKGLISGMGIINGVNTFGAQLNITYEQAVTIMVRALGYETAAMSKGGYPDGHLLVAQEEGLLQGITSTKKAVVNRGLIAQLTYNALEVPMMIKVGSNYIKSGTQGTYKLFLFNDLHLINEAAANGNWGTIDENTFTKAGITGVTAGNLANIKSTLQTLANGNNKNWSPAQIQGVFNNMTTPNQPMEVTYINSNNIAIDNIVYAFNSSSILYNQSGTVVATGGSGIDLLVDNGDVLENLVIENGTIKSIKLKRDASVEAGQVVSDITALTLSATPTPAQITAVKNARIAYTALTSGGKALVGNLSVLEGHEGTIVTSQIAALTLSAIPTPSQIAAVQAARVSFTELTQGAKLSVTNLAVLVGHEATIEGAATKALIAALPNPLTTITLTDKADIMDARASYSALSAAGKFVVDAIDAGKDTAYLIQAESQIMTLESEALKIENAKTALTGLPFTVARNTVSPVIGNGVTSIAGETYTFTAVPLATTTPATLTGGGKAVITTSDATITRDTSQQFKFEIDVVITAGSTSETVTFTVTVPTGLSNVTMVKN